ncbi:MAG: hypothetical protein ABR577_10590 [Pyrinomonadaceae bacterium]
MRLKVIILFVAVLIAISAGAIKIASKVQEQSSLSQTMPEKGRLKWHAQKAKAKGQQEVFLSGPIVEYDGSASSISTDELLSDYTVVEARPIDARSSFSDSNEIITWYKFKILDTLSRQNSPACNSCPTPEPPQELLPLQVDEFLVSKVGGSLMIDGVKVTMLEGGFPPFKINQEYLLFISKHESGVTEIAGGPIGVFNITGDGALTPINSQPHPIKERIVKNLGDSLDKVRGKLKTRTAIQP